MRVRDLWCGYPNIRESFGNTSLATALSPVQPHTSPCPSPLAWFWVLVELGLSCFPASLIFYWEWQFNKPCPQTTAPPPHLW